MSKKIKILAIAGSLREKSLNRRILKAAAEGAAQAGAEVMLIDLNEFPMPLYNEDRFEENGFDARALEFQRLVRDADAFLVASPEYNGSITAALKNAIDWASRPSGEFPRHEIFQKKFAAIMTASPGSFGGVRTLSHLRAILTSVGTFVLPTEIAVTFAEQKFDGDRVTDERTKETLENLGAALVETVAAMKHGAARAVNGK
jgi:chromate reductase, NAD(P)H dehydrogenase (quinone)